ncbi:hypothetical protein MKW98_009961, partial [Papaver atlanticum]
MADQELSVWDGFMTRWIKPDLIVESGAFKGHSTWVLRQAMLDTPILSLTPRQEGSFLCRWQFVTKKHGVTDLSWVLISSMIIKINLKDSDEARIREKKKKFWEKPVDINELCGPGEAWWGVRYKEHFQNSRFVESILDVYWELPPVAGPSLTHQTRYDPAHSVSPIVEDGRFGLFQRLGLSRFDSSVFNGYTQIVYVNILKSSS